jgi:hypothetical protein
MLLQVIFKEGTEAPTQPPVIAPTISPIVFIPPVSIQVVPITIGTFTVAYTSPGQSEPSIDDYLNIIGTNDFYFYDAVEIHFFFFFIMNSLFYVKLQILVGLPGLFCHFSCWISRRVEGVCIRLISSV